MRFHLHIAKIKDTYLLSEPSAAQTKISKKKNKVIQPTSSSICCCTRSIILAMDWTYQGRGKITIATACFCPLEGDISFRTTHILLRGLSPLARKARGKEKGPHAKLELQFVLKNHFLRYVKLGEENTSEARY